MLKSLMAEVLVDPVEARGLKLRIAMKTTAQMTAQARKRKTRSWRLRSRRSMPRWGLCITNEDTML